MVRRPHVNLFALGCQSASDQPRVIADSAGLGGVFSRDQVPGCPVR